MRFSVRLGVLVAAVASALALVNVIGAVGALTGTDFEIEGDLVAQTGSDWCNEVVTLTSKCAAGELVPNFRQQADLPPGGGDDSFAGGTKQDTEGPGVAGGSIPAKGDLDRFYVGSELRNGKNFLYLGFELLPVSNASASVHQGFEFNKLVCTPNANDADCSANGITPDRSAGDILIVFDIEGGGDPQLTYRRWVLSGGCEIKSHKAPCWGPSQEFDATTADAALNTADVSDPIEPDAPRTIGTFRFGEAAVNLTDSGILTGCQAFGSGYTVSRSSGDSGTAQMKDFIRPLEVNINNCGSIVVRKVTNPSSDTTSSFAFTAGGGLTPSSFNLSGGGSRTFSGIEPKSGYSVAETVPSGWNLDSATCDDGSPVSNIDVAAGETVTCTFTNSATYTTIVLVCRDSDQTLHSSKVSFDGGALPSTPNSLGSPPSGMTHAQLCGLGGARHANQVRGVHVHSASIDIP